MCRPDRAPGTPGRGGKQDSGLLRQSCRGCPQPLASLPQVCGGKLGLDGLSADGKENSKENL